MNKHELSISAAVLELARIQQTLGLGNAEFVRASKFEMASSSWDKIKAGTWAGNCDNALAAVEAALVLKAWEDDKYQTAGDTVILDHIQEAFDAVDIARKASDEHRLVVVSGGSGAGKSTTCRFLQDSFGGNLINAKPSWERSYMHTLLEFASGLGFAGNWTSAGRAESAIIKTLAISPRLIIIDEANHFNRESLNFLKSIINETKCCLVLMTLPHHLARMQADHREEAPQLLRRSVAIIHIPTVTPAEVKAIGHGLYPELDLTECATQIANLSNTYHQIDTVRRVLDEMSNGFDARTSINRIKRALTAVTK